MSEYERLEKLARKLLDNTLGERILETEDSTLLKLATQSAIIEKLQTRISLLKNRLSNAESARAKESRRASEAESLLRQMERTLEKARTNAKYYKLVILTNTLPEDTAQEILNLRRWIQISVSSLQRAMLTMREKDIKADPDLIREFEINLPWLTESTDYEKK